MEKESNPTCSTCGKVFKRNKDLYYHLRKVHKMDYIVSGKLICPISDCGSGFCSFSALRYHISSAHHIVIEEEKLTFQSEEDFFIWKESMETESGSSYIVKSVRHFGRFKKMYYSCHRSGMHVSTSTGRRADRKTGSCKIGCHCPSTIDAVVGDEIEVVFYKTHVGHTSEIEHLVSRKTRSRKEEFAILARMRRDPNPCLPDGYLYGGIEEHPDSYCFRIKEVVDATSAKDWIKKFSESSFVTWRVAKTYPKERRDYSFRIDYRCPYNIAKGARGEHSTKDTNCPAVFSLKIKRLFEEYPTLVVLKHYHNHLLEAPCVLKPRKSKKKISILSSYIDPISEMNHHSNQKTDRQTENLVASDLCESETDEVFGTTEDHQQFEALLDKMKNHVTSNPSLFVPAMRNMVRNANIFANNENDLAYAMQTFGCLNHIQIIGQNNKSTSVQPIVLGRKELGISFLKAENS